MDISRGTLGLDDFNVSTLKNYVWLDTEGA
jgi:hypothetical protein